MQRTVDTKIEEDMFSVGPSRDNVTGTEPNQGVAEGDREWSESSAVKGSTEDDCELL
jgi:hypothetical protein